MRKSPLAHFAPCLELSANLMQVKPLYFKINFLYKN